MAVYIEYVILDNLIINTIIIYLTCQILKVKPKKLNVFLTSTFGTICAIFMPFLTLNNYIMFTLKICVALLMVFMLKKYKNFKSYIVTLLLFLTCTFALGGICFGIMYMFNANVSMNGIIINGFELPISLFLLLIGTYVYFMFQLVIVMRKKQVKQPYLYSLVIKQDNKTYNLEGFLDSGNHLYHSGQPVVVISQKMFSKIFSNISYDKVLLQRITKSDISGADYIVANAINGAKKMLVFHIQELQIFENKKTTCIKGAMLALANTNFNNEFDCLLHPDLFY